MELARALQSAVNAQKVPMQRKREQLAMFERNVDDTLDKVATETGMTTETIAEIRKGVLGLRD